MYSSGKMTSMHTLYYVFVHVSVIVVICNLQNKMLLDSCMDQIYV